MRTTCRADFTNSCNLIARVAPSEYAAEKFRDGAVIMKTDFTPKQGQYLAFIYYFIRLPRRSPALADIQRYLLVSPPAAQQMILK